MKKIFLIGITILLFSCQKEEINNVSNAQTSDSDPDVTFLNSTTINRSSNNTIDPIVGKWLKKWTVISYEFVDTKEFQRTKHLDSSLDFTNICPNVTPSTADIEYKMDGTLTSYYYDYVFDSEINQIICSTAILTSENKTWQKNDSRMYIFPETIDNKSYDLTYPVWFVGNWMIVRTNFLEIASALGNTSNNFIFPYNAVIDQDSDDERLIKILYSDIYYKKN